MQGTGLLSGGHLVPKLLGNLRRKAKLNIFRWLPSGELTESYWKLPFIVDFPINSMVIFHCYVNVYQRVVQNSYPFNIQPLSKTRSSSITPRIWQTQCQNNLPWLGMVNDGKCTPPIYGKIGINHPLPFIYHPAMALKLLVLKKPWSKLSVFFLPFHFAAWPPPQMPRTVWRCVVVPSSCITMGPRCGSMGTSSSEPPTWTTTDLANCEGLRRNCGGQGDVPPEICLLVYKTCIN